MITTVYKSIKIQQLRRNYEKSHQLTQRYYMRSTLLQYSCNWREEGAEDNAARPQVPWGHRVSGCYSSQAPAASDTQWSRCHLLLTTPFPTRAPCSDFLSFILTFSSDALPILVNCFNFSEATAFVYFPAWSGLFFSSSFLRFSFSFSFICFWYFFFLRSRFLSVAVFSAAVFMSPALFFSYWK